MTTKKLFLLTIAGGIVYFLLASLLPDSGYLVGIGVFFVLGLFVFSALTGHQAYQARKNRDSTNKRTEIEEGTREVSLSEKEITFLKKKMWRKMATSIFAFLFIYSIYLTAANFFLPLLFGELGTYLFWILSGAIFFAAVYFFEKHIHKLRKDIRNGNKLVVVGNVTRWAHYNENDYVLYVDQISFRVNPATFAKYAKGDAIEVHLFEPWQNLVLSDKRIEKQ
ncbi:MAG: hypothetical protein SH819_15140 [Cytophagales bacterium]|nr:hypothetical protein [Cytophagales bacterium]